MTASARLPASVATPAPPTMPPGQIGVWAIGAAAGAVGFAYAARHAPAPYGALAVGVGTVLGAALADSLLQLAFAGS